LRPPHPNVLAFLLTTYVALEGQHLEGARDDCLCVLPLLLHKMSTVPGKSTCKSQDKFLSIVLR
jgi:hypothetical protein